MHRRMDASPKPENDADKNSVCGDCKRWKEPDARWCPQCQPKHCLMCDRRNDNYPHSPYCGTCR